MNIEEIKTELARQEKALANRRLFALMGEKIQLKVDGLRKQLSDLEGKVETKVQEEAVTKDKKKDAKKDLAQKKAFNKTSINIYTERVAKMTAEEIKTELPRHERALKSKTLIKLGYKEIIEAKINLLKKQLKLLKISKVKIDSLAKKVGKIKHLSYQKPIEKLTTELFKLLVTNNSLIESGGNSNTVDTEDEMNAKVIELIRIGKDREASRLQADFFLNAEKKDIFLNKISIDNIIEIINYFEKPHLYSASINLIATENYADGNMDCVSILIEKHTILIEETFKVEGKRGVSFSRIFDIFVDNDSDISDEYENLVEISFEDDNLIEEANRCISMFLCYSTNRLAMNIKIKKRVKKILKKKNK